MGYPVAMLVCIATVLSLAQTATIPVFVVSYFPTVGDQIDAAVTGDVHGSYSELRNKTERLTQECCKALEEGSRFRGYKLPSKPALVYKVVGQVEFREALPVVKEKGAIDDSRHSDAKSREGHFQHRAMSTFENRKSTTENRPPEAPMTDYNAIMKRIDAKKLVEKQGVKEIWIWGYHGGVVGLWESNMSSPHGDVSNSSRDPKDLPLFDRTYTVYHYNYGRGLGEMLENHMHQLEHLLNHVDGRESTPPEKWSELLFWGKFVGSDASHKIVTNPARCGWTHYAPNSESDYDWANPRYVETDIEDWKPDGFGKTQRMNADRWGRDGIKWRVYWMQAIPGLDNGLTYRGRKLRNWWSFVSDWDKAKREKWTLVE